MIGNLVFDPVGETDSELTQTDYGTLRLIDTGNGPNIADPEAPTTPVDPSHYELKTAEGLIYVLDQAFGIKHVVDQSGNTISFSDAGIQHSNGVSIPFTRDAQGRITRISLPDGQTLQYRYDANGDLIESKDPLNYATTISYLANPRYPHWLETIRDPLGNRAIKNEYGTDGRLIATVDANNQRQEFTHSLSGHTTTVKNRRGHVTTYGFDDRGNVLSESNALGETITRSYDADGNELTVTDPLDRTTTRTYDTRGNVLTETNDLGETTTRTYNRANQLRTEHDHSGRLVAENVYHRNIVHDETGVLASSTDGEGNTTYFQVDLTRGNGDLDWIDDANGARTRFEYDLRGNVWRETDASGKHTVRTYDAMGRVLTETQTRQRNGQTETLTTTHRYDAKGQLLETIQPNGDSSSRIYDANGRVIREVLSRDPEALRTNYLYDSLGRLVRTTYPDLTTELTTYDAEGNTLTQTDRMGRVTKMVYDAANRLVETIYPDAGVNDGNDANNPRTKSDFDEAGQLIASWDELNRPTEFRYDDAGRQTEVIDALGHSSHSVYDDTGRRIASIDALDRTTKFVYDEAGRMIETILPDATTDDGDDRNNARITMEYDATGRKISETDPSGRTTAFDYDSRGQLIEVVQPGALSTRYGYDEQGRKITQTDALNRTTRWTYDKLGRVLTRTLPMGQAEHSAYNQYGALATQTDFNGQTRAYTLDVQQRPTRIDDADGRYEQVIYDLLGRRTSVTTPNGVWTFGYDSRSRVITETQPNGITLNYQYDKVGNRTRLDEVSSTGTSTTLYQYDALNRMISAKQDAAPAITYAYNELGLRIEEVQGALTTTYTHDRQNRLTRIETNRGTEFVRSLDYLVDESGLRRAQIEREVIAGVTTDRRIDYTYDDLKRLTSEVERDGAGNVVRSGTWTYDSVGNRLTQVTTDGIAPTAKTATTTYAYDSNDRLLSEAKTVVDAGTTTSSTTTHRYDLNGSLLESTSTDGSARYKYNADQRLVEVRKANGELFQFAYDPDDLRMSRTAAGATTNFAIDRNLAYGEVISERETNGVLKARYLHTDQLAQQTTLNAGVPAVGYPLRDAIGSTRYLADQMGSVTDSLRYTAWGESVARSGSSSIANSFAGEYYEGGVGLSFNRARWYSGQLGGFTQMDLSSGCSLRPASLHRFNYGEGQPTLHVDPSGNVVVISELLFGSGIQGFGRRFEHSAKAQKAYSAMRSVCKSLETIGAGLGKVARHHVVPHFVTGGLLKKKFDEEFLMRLNEAAHNKFHTLLDIALRFGGFVGRNDKVMGQTATQFYDNLYARNPAARADVFMILLDVADVFDSVCQNVHGKSLSREVKSMRGLID